MSDHSNIASSPATRQIMSNIEKPTMREINSMRVFKHKNVSGA